MGAGGDRKRGCFFYGAVRDSLPEKVTFEQSPTASAEPCGYLRRSSTEGRAGAKALRQGLLEEQQEGAVLGVGMRLGEGEGMALCSLFYSQEWAVGGL